MTTRCGQNHRQLNSGELWLVMGRQPWHTHAETSPLQGTAGDCIPTLATALSPPSHETFLWGLDDLGPATHSALPQRSSGYQHKPPILSYCGYYPGVRLYCAVLHLVGNSKERSSSVVGQAVHGGCIWAIEGKRSAHVRLLPTTQAAHCFPTALSAW